MVPPGEVALMGMPPPPHIFLYHTFQAGIFRSQPAPLFYSSDLPYFFDRIKANGFSMTTSFRWELESYRRYRRNFC
jgi:hypothetical protein